MDDHLIPKRKGKTLSKFDELKKHKKLDGGDFMSNECDYMSHSFDDLKPSDDVLKHMAFRQKFPKTVQLCEDNQKQNRKERLNRFEELKSHKIGSDDHFDSDGTDIQFWDDQSDDGVNCIQDAIDTEMTDKDGVMQSDSTASSGRDSVTTDSASNASNTETLENGSGKFAISSSHVLNHDNGNMLPTTLPDQAGQAALSTVQKQVTETVPDVIVEPLGIKRNGGYHPNTLEIAQRVIIRYHVRNVNGDLVFRDPDNCVYRNATRQEILGYILEECIKEAQMYGKPDILKNSSEFMSALTALAPEDIISDKDTIAFQNCFYDYGSNLYRPFSEYGDRYVTASIQASIRADGYDCEHFHSFARYAFYGNSALFERFMELLGLFLSNDMNAKVMGVFYGPSNTGKSLAIQIFQMFYEPDKTESILAIQKYGDRFALSTIIGKHLMSFGDLPNDIIPDAALSNIKAITGKDKVQVEAKYMPLHGYRPECKLLFGTNHNLITSSKDEAFEQRVIVVPFLRQVPKDKMDGDLGEKIKAEKGAIAREAIKAYRRLRKNKYQFTPLPPEYDVEIFESCLNVSMDSDKTNQALFEVQVFFDTCCEFDVNAFMSTEGLYREYCKFCDSNLLVRRHKKYFSTLLNQVCGDKIEKHKQGSLNGFLGIAIKKD